MKNSLKLLGNEIPVSKTCTSLDFFFDICSIGLYIHIFIGLIYKIILLNFFWCHIRKLLIRVDSTKLFLNRKKSKFSFILNKIPVFFITKSYDFPLFSNTDPSICIVPGKKFIV
jgi:hypothetical protein